MLRIFLILSLAVALAGVGFSFVLKDRVRGLSEQRDTFRSERDVAQEAERQAKAAEKKAKDAEKAAKDELATTRTDLENATTQLNETTGRLTRTATELEETKVARDTAQRRHQHRLARIAHQLFQQAKAVGVEFILLVHGAVGE